MSRNYVDFHAKLNLTAMLNTWDSIKAERHSILD